MGTSFKYKRSPLKMMDELRHKRSPFTATAQKLKQTFWGHHQGK